MLQAHMKPKEVGKRGEKIWRGVRWRIHWVSRKRHEGETEDVLSGTATVSMWNGDDSKPEDTVMTAFEVYELLVRLTPRDLEIMGVSGGVDSLAGMMFKSLPVLPAPMRNTGVRDGRPLFHAWSYNYNKVAHAVARIESSDPDTHSKHVSSAQDAVNVMIDPKVLGKKKPTKATTHHDSMKESVEHKAGDVPPPTAPLLHQLVTHTAQPCANPICTICRIIAHHRTLNQQGG